MPESKRRSLLSEILRPLGLGLLVVTLLLLLFRAREATLGAGRPITVVAQILGASLPAILVAAIPISLFFAVLSAAVRLSPSGERSPVGSLRTLYRPILLLCAVLTLVNTLLVFFAAPWGDAYLQKLRGPPPRHAAPKIEPRDFCQIGDMALYVFGQRPEDGRWMGVFLAKHPPDSESTVITAEWGQLQAEEGGGLLLKLGNARMYTADLDDPRAYRILYHRELSFPITRAQTYSEIAATMRQMTPLELLRKADEPSLPPRISSALRVEVHRRLALPVVCMVLGLVALPLGLKLRVGPAARLAVFVIVPISVILLYHITLYFLARAATAGRLTPWLAMWLPNLLVAAVGLVLWTRRIRVRGILLSLVLTFAVLITGALVASYLLPFSATPEPWRWRVDGNRIYTWDDFDSETNRLLGLQFFDLSERFYLRDHVFVTAAQLHKSLDDGGGDWTAEDGWQRSFDESGMDNSVQPIQQTRIPLPGPSFFDSGI